MMHGTVCKMCLLEDIIQKNELIKKTLLFYLNPSGT